MLVVCYGIPKSGSTLAFEMVRAVLNGTGHPQQEMKVGSVAPTKRGINFLHAEGETNRITIEGLLGIIAETGDRISAVKTHEHFDPRLFASIEALQRERKLQVIASYRDPRELCLSLLDAASNARARGQNAFFKVTDMEGAILRVEKRIKQYRRWAALKGSLRLYYDTVAFTPHVAIDAIENCLGFKADRAQVMKHAFEDSFTQKNKGVPQRYLTELSDDERRLLTDRFREFIEGPCQGRDEEWLSECRERILRSSGAASLAV